MVYTDGKLSLHDWNSAIGLWFDVCMCHCIYGILYIYIYSNRIVYSASHHHSSVRRGTRPCHRLPVRHSVHPSTNQNETRDYYTNRCPPLIYFVVEEFVASLVPTDRRDVKTQHIDFHVFIFPSIRPSVSHCTRVPGTTVIATHRQQQQQPPPPSLQRYTTHTHKKESPQQHQSCIWNYLE